MDFSNWVSLAALAIASGALALEVRRWRESGPRLHLSCMADAVTFPDDNGEPKLALTVINRGAAPTTLTHMVGYIYKSPWQRIRHHPSTAGVVAANNIPFQLGVNQTWIGMMTYNEKTSDARKKGHLYVGVISAHSSGHFLVRVPPPKTDIPEGEI